MEFKNIQEEMQYVKKRNAFIKELESFVEEKDYTKVDINYFEPYEEFIEQNKRVKKASMVKLIDPEGNINILRPDITTNIIKQVLYKWVDGSQLKLYYDANIFRQENRKIEEIRQFGLEQLGYQDLQAEKDVLNSLTSILQNYQIDYKIRMGSSAFINAIFEELSFSKEKTNQIKNALQAKNQQALLNLLDQANQSNPTLSFLRKLLSYEGKAKDVLKRLSLEDLKEPLQEAITELDKVIDSLDEGEHIWIDLSLVPEYDYYNGITIEGYTRNLATPLFQGGRYDKLTKQFGREISAFGVSFDYKAFIMEVVDYE
jgi:ATP phosphoribosyltransferase regulatory subunit